MNMTFKDGFPIWHTDRTFAFIINYNRLELPKKLADWLYNHGCEPVFIDNNSDYPPLLEYYSHRCPYPVMRMDKNYGYKVFWEQVLPKIVLKKRYIVTDPDLDLSGIPKDFLNILNIGLDVYRDVDKCGLSLRIDDLPPNSLSQQIKNWESQFWLHRLDGMFFKAITDTTLALYRENVTNHSLSAIRTDRPYTARHMPWYYANIEELPEDEKYYLKTSSTSTHWTEQIKEKGS